MARSNANLNYHITVTQGKGSNKVTLHDEEYTMTQDVPFNLPDDNKKLAQIGRSFGQTVNIGNFQSVRVDASVTVPCDIGDMEEAERFAAQWVSDKVAKDVADICERTGSKNTVGDA